jgi:4-amino-4-deoxy-L-arabinose transferase-like glycosyltransferase
MIEAPVREQEQTTLQEGAHHPLRWWQTLALFAVLLISVFFDFFALDQQDFFEYYYAATVKSMLMSWHTFFFASFDPAGFEGIDKPALGFWIQVLSAKLLGFSAFSVLLPGALAGVLAVGLLFQLVRRVFGPTAGLIAALALALSPISVVTNRNNLVDNLLVPFVLLAAWAVSKAAETGRLRWLCLCAFLLGLGFNIKFLQAYLVIPAFGLVYLLGAPLRWRTKIGQLALAVVILLVVSLSWATIVDLTPITQRPSFPPSELRLIFFIHGASNLSSSDTTWAWEIGKPGPLRFFEHPLGEQSSWLLPLALLSMLALSWQRRWRLPLQKQQQALVLWGTWLLTMVVLFSDAGFFHAYYFSMLAPAIAALVGAGVVTLWRDYVRPGWHGWLLPAALLLTGAFQASLLVPFPQWSSLLTPSIVGACVIVALALLLARLRFPLRFQPVVVTISTLGLLSLLLAPTVWAALPLGYGRAFPIAGPQADEVTNIPADHADPLLVRYLLAHKGHAQFLLATMTSAAAAPIILDTGQAAMALGGYVGADRILTRNQLIQQIDAGTVRFFLLPSLEPDPSILAGIPASAREALRQAAREEKLAALLKSLPEEQGWVITHCREVPTNQWQTPSTARPDGALYQSDRLQLYDCAHHT